MFNEKNHKIMTTEVTTTASEVSKLTSKIERVLDYAPSYTYETFYYAGFNTIHVKNDAGLVAFIKVRGNMGVAYYEIEAFYYEDLKALLWNLPNQSEKQIEARLDDAQTMKQVLIDMLASDKMTKDMADSIHISIRKEESKIIHLNNAFTLFGLVSDSRVNNMLESAMFTI